MDFDDFTGQVQHRARLSDTAQALQATRSTLSTLAERLDEGAATNVAGQLPREVKDYLTGHGAAQQFGLDEFYERVAQKEGVERPEAVHHARAVLSVVDEAAPGVLAKERQQLTGDFDRLFDDIAEFRATYS